MAQDWRAAFDLGDTDTRIPMVDANGVAMVSIQALHHLLTDLQSELQAVQAELSALRSATNDRPDMTSTSGGSPDTSRRA
jgi:hypothetical protein